MAEFNRDWEQAAQRRLSEHVDRAARPHRGYLPSEAEAVLFRDEGEMLACLALDMARGEHLYRWWWKTVLRNLPSSVRNNVTALFCYQARQLPAMLNFLDSWNEASRIVNSLDNSAVSTILRTLVQEYGLSESLLPPAPGAIKAVGTSGTDVSRSETAGKIMDVPPPWIPWLAKEQTQGMAAMHECLLGVGLGLHRATTKVRSPLFALEVNAWWKASGSKVQDVDTTDVTLSVTQFYERAPRISEETSSVAPQRESHVDATSPKSPQSTQAISFFEDVSLPDGQTSPKTFEESEFATAKPTDDLPAEGVKTNLGGILYLINLLDYLELPDCFEEEWNLASRIGMWGLVELLAKGLLDERFQSLQDDPIWTVIANLDVREPQDLPGSDFVGCDSFRVHLSWFESVHRAGVPFRWASTSKQLRLWSESGYLMVETPRSQTPPSRQAHNELHQYLTLTEDIELTRDRFDNAPLTRMPQSLNGLNEHLSRWLSMALPFIRCRLQQALSSEPSADDPLSEVLFCPGRLYITSTHIDLVADIDRISLPVRMAGLDRDPGWKPELGRVITFHFR